MLNPKKLPTDIRAQLTEAGFTRLEELTVEAAFAAWCKYEGLMGSYSFQLIRVIDALREAAGSPATIALTDRLTQAHKDGWDACADGVREWLGVQSREG